MAITNHTELVAAVKSWTLRTDAGFSAAIDDFIALGEERMYHGAPDENSPALRVREMETEATISFTSGVGALPSDYLMMRSLTRDNDGCGLTLAPPHEFEPLKAVNTNTGYPIYFTMKGSNIELAPVWTGDLDALYVKRVAALTSVASTNDILTNYPNVYLYAVLIEAFEWIANDARQAKALNRYNGAVRAANKTTTEGQRSGVQPRLKPRIIV